jgi:hypothetical protein
MGYFWTPAKPDGNIFGELGEIIGSKRAHSGFESRCYQSTLVTDGRW